jgi:hypothetical protein
VVIRAEIPPQPFSEGVLKGALSPRHLAEKAKAHPKEAASYFESGAVARWYKDNGWAYPVQGSIATGVGAVQQFFEALGLTPAPKVEVSATAISLQGQVGQTVNYSLFVSTSEKRPVYASATSNQPWLLIGRTKLEGRRATIPLMVSQVPDSEDAIHRAEVTVTANGNQRFVIPVTFESNSGFNFGEGSFAVEAEENVPAVFSEFQFDATADENEPVGADAQELISPDFGSHEKSAKAGKPRAKVRLRLPSFNYRQLVHAIPALGLGLALLLILILDVLTEPTSFQRKEVKSQAIQQIFLSNPVIGINFRPETRRFGVVVLKESDPNDPEKPKRLTFDPAGATNNTCIRIEKDDSLFGRLPGKWASEKGRRLDLVEEVKGQKWKSVMDYPGSIRVIQTVAVFPNEETLNFDTCLVHYLVENRSTEPRNVGVRFMLDAAIGDNHGVPFRIPGNPELLETKGDFQKDEIPEYIQVLERSDIQDPGTVAYLGLNLPGFKLNESDPQLDPMERVVICRWKDSDVRWDWDFKPINENPQNKSSCVVLYWPEESLPAGASRVMAFTYGLGRITSPRSGGLELSLDRLTVRPGQDFTVMAQVQKHQPGQMIFIHLPENAGFSLGEGQQEGKSGGEKGQATWKVQAGSAGSYHLVVTSGLSRADLEIVVRRSSGFR